MISSRSISAGRVLAWACALFFALGLQAQQVRPSISILGDSYSTFEGYIPEGNAIWYRSPADTTRTDVVDVEQTWWWQVIHDGGYRLCRNEAWSGSTVAFQGMNGKDMEYCSFITRLPRMGNPDIILIYGAINDCRLGVPLGEYKYDNITRNDLNTYRPALARLLSDALKRYPNVRIYFIINDDMRDDIATSTKIICDHYAVPYIHLQPLEVRSGHPTAAGMRSIAQQVLGVIGKVQH